MSDDKPLVDPDAKIDNDQYTHQSDGDWWGPWVTEGYGADRDRYDQFWADGDPGNDGAKPKITGSGWLNGLPPADDFYGQLSGVRESAHEVWNLIQGKGFSDFSGILDLLASEVGLATDAMSIVDDPAGTLTDWAVSWALEHVTILRMALDGLAGNPDVVQAYSGTWANIAGRLQEVGGQFSATAMTGPGTWTGSAHDAYQTMASDVSEGIDAVTQLAQGTSTLLAGFAQLVNGVRDLVKALISELVALVVDAIEAVCGDEGQATGGLERAAADTGAKVLHLLARLAEIAEYLGPIITAAEAVLSAIAAGWKQYKGA